jgi:hypothetical protein
LEMKVRMITPLFSLGAALVMALVVNAQEPAAPDAAVADEPAIEESVDLAGGVPEHVRDAGFTPFVDLLLLGEALNDQDPAALCDVGLQLVDGERALLRPHRGIKARTVFDIALRFAVAKKDRESLERLTKIAEKLGDSELKQMISASQPLLAAARSPGVSVKLEDLDVNDVLTYQSYTKEILRARALQDIEDLEAMKAGLEESPNMSGAMRAQIGKDIDQAIKDAQAPKSPEELEALRALAAAARDSNKGDVRSSVSKGWLAVAWGKEIDHVEYLKLAGSMASGTVGVYLSGLVRDSAATLGTSVVIQAIKKRGQTFGAGKFVCQAGIATYDHWKYLVVKNPITGKTVKKVKTNLPNTHQPYIRWKRK